jgi:creatinine amidohydrolase
MIYGNCRWPEVQQWQKDRMVLVCPLASFEQHGRHLPFLTDTYLTDALAQRVHQKLGDRIALTPTLWLGASDHHLDFPGVISVPHSLYTEVVKNMVRCFVKSGFRRVFLLNGHGGNASPATVAITEMANCCDSCDEAFLTLASYWTLAAPVMKAEKHGMGSQQLSHSCEYETSMMLHLHKELVVMRAARAAKPVIENRFYSNENLGRVTVAGRFKRQSKTGALGRPELATAEKGESLLTAISDEIAAFIEDFATWKFLPVLKREIAPWGKRGSRRSR